MLLTNATHPAVDVNKPVNALRARFANAVVAADRAVESGGVGRYLIKRLAEAIITLLGVAVLVFIVSACCPATRSPPGSAPRPAT